MSRDEKYPKISFIKRKSTLKKKARELATLCDASVCLICYSPDGELDTWPEDQSVVKDIVTRYKGLAEKDEVRKQNLDLKRFLEMKKKKSQVKAEKSSNKAVNLEELPTWDERLNELPKEELKGLAGFLESKLQILNERRRLLEIDNRISDQAKEIQVVDLDDRLIESNLAPVPVDNFNLYNEGNNSSTDFVMQQEYYYQPLLMSSTDVGSITPDYGAMMFDHHDQAVFNCEIWPCNYNNGSTRSTSCTPLFLENSETGFVMDLESSYYQSLLMTTTDNGDMVFDHHDQAVFNGEICTPLSLENSDQTNFFGFDPFGSMLVDSDHNYNNITNAIMTAEIDNNTDNALLDDNDGVLGFATNNDFLHEVLPISVWTQQPLM